MYIQIIYWEEKKVFDLLMGTMHQVLGVHSVPSTEIWPLNSSIKKRKELLVHPTQAISDIDSPQKNRRKLHIFAARCDHLTTGREIDN